MTAQLAAFCELSVRPSQKNARHGCARTTAGTLQKLDAPTDSTGRGDCVTAGTRRPISEAAARGYSRPARRRRRRIPRRRDRQLAIAMAYPAQQPSRRKLIELYLADGGRRDGAETFALVIRQDWRLARVRGPGAGTTGPRRATGLAAAGRPRVRRTVQRHRKRAVKLGVAVYQHVKLSKGTPGRRDYLRVFLLSPHRCHPALRQQPKGLRPYLAASAACGDQSVPPADAGRERGPPGAALIAPAAPARDHPAASPLPPEGTGRRETAASERGEGAKRPPEIEGTGQLTLLCEACQSPLTLSCGSPIWEADCPGCGLLVALPPAHPLRAAPDARTSGQPPAAAGAAGVSSALQKATPAPGHPELRLRGRA